MVLAAEPPELSIAGPIAVIDRARARLVDQRHAALVHAVRDQEIVLGARNHIDDGIADSENVVTGSGHEWFLVDERRRTIASMIRGNAAQAHAA